jgi:hypothetical protein
MPPADFKKLIQDCRSQRELEAVLTRWHEMRATLGELKQVREAWLARWVSLDHSSNIGAAFRMGGMQPA